MTIRDLDQRRRQAFNEGRDAYKMGRRTTENPYISQVSFDTEKQHWYLGWSRAKRDAEPFIPSTEDET